jgi:hypothetical protein
MLQYFSVSRKISSTFSRLSGLDFSKSFLIAKYVVIGTSLFRISATISSIFSDFNFSKVTNSHSLI